MEGPGDIEGQDQTVDSRFRVMQAVDCSNIGRTKGNWYTATPPLCRCWSGLSPTDYFGRMMVANLPDSIRVGVINVSVAGCKIELFDKDNYQDYVSSVTEDWLINIINEYNGNPYQYLVDLAKQAQQDGIIKGFLLHQGESNTGDKQWPTKVKKIYQDLINDLSLDADSVPLLAGEVVGADQGGVCASMNSIINVLPDTLSSAYVISSTGCTAGPDNLHFNSAGYRELGRRYAVRMLSLQGDTITVGRGTEAVYLEPACAIYGKDWDIMPYTGASNGTYVTITPGMNSTNQAPSDSAGTIYFPFTIDTAGFFSVYARMNCPNTNDDSFWVKIDDNPFQAVDGLFTSGWQWRRFIDAELSAGNHVLAVAYREDGAKLDKIAIANLLYAPSGMGAVADNLCVPDTATVPPITIYLETECGTVGSTWDIKEDSKASNGRYTEVKSGNESLSVPATDSADLIFLTFSVDTTDNFNVFARLNCLSTHDDSFWISIDDGNFTMYNDMQTSGWQWKKLSGRELSKGSHTIAIAYREDGAKLDKLCVTNTADVPAQMGGEAVNICAEDTTNTGINETEANNSYLLEQNFPN
ncbi:MAG TPA: sialate O-acetylesterase, partial [Bacteroidales bacterium]|nr:sialate O-acetylesterase [Bacteroidales bacterium]